MSLRLDHLVVAARSLEEGAHWLEEKLGLPLVAGGQHVAMGTHNRLLNLGESTYLELIAIDPALPAPARPRWFDLDAKAMQARLERQPQLIHWVARSTDILTDASTAGVDESDIIPMSRGDLRWRISVPTDGHLPGDGLLPTLIQWDVPFHPTERLPESNCRLMKLEAFTAHATQRRSALRVMGLADSIDLHPVSPGDNPEWVAYLKTPRGLIELSGSLSS